MLSRICKSVLSLMFISLSLAAMAKDVISVRTIGMELALDMARQAITECRQKGYQVSAVVVDRNGNVRVALRDDLAARFTLEISQRKANATVMSGVESGNFRKQRSDIRQELNHIEGLIMLEGGIPIEAGGHRIGAIGVSGAPGGDKDAICAKQAVQKFRDRLEFAD